MPTNNNGNSKTDAIALLNSLNIRGNGATPKTFMDCVKALANEVAEERKEKAKQYSEILKKIGIKTNKDLVLQMVREPMKSIIKNKINNSVYDDLLVFLNDGAWTPNHIDVPTRVNFLKWCLGLEPEDMFDNSNHKSSAYGTARFSQYVFVLRAVVEGNLDVSTKLKKLEGTITTLKQSNNLFMEEIDTLTKVIEDNGIKMCMCELCNKKLDGDDLDENGKPHTKCGNNICLTCIKKIQPTRNNTTTDANSEILCPEAIIPFSYFKTLCPYCRQCNCLPKYNEYNELVVDTMKSLINWSNIGKIHLTPSFVKMSNAMYKITGRHYLKVRTIQ